MMGVAGVPVVRATTLGSCASARRSTAGECSAEPTMSRTFVLYMMMAVVTGAHNPYSIASYACANVSRMCYSTCRRGRSIGSSCACHVKHHAS